MTKTINPIKDTITPIKGCKAVIYQHELSDRWWVRCRIDGRYLIRTTGEKEKRDALKQGEKIYFDLLLDNASDPSKSRNRTTRSFCAIAFEMNERTKLQSSSGTAKNELAMINNQLVPYFKDRSIDAIDYKEIVKFYSHVDSLTSVKKHTLGQPWQTQTKKHLIMTFKKIFYYAQESNKIAQVPSFPRWVIKAPTKTARDYLTWNEYNVLMRSVLSLVKASAKGHRTQDITTEIKCLINFMVNSFIRPSDLKVLKHKHIEIKKDKKSGDEWLRMTHPATKTSDLPMISTQYCPNHYRELLEYREETKEKGKTWIDGDDYIFLPWLRDEDPTVNEVKRKYALQTLGKCFSICVSNTPLLREKNITLYSLRHTSIMFRLMYGDDIDTLYLARNARTSQFMIEKFYAQHLTGDLVREKLHSMRNKLNLPIS